MNVPSESKGYVPVPRCVLSSPILHSNEERLFFIELCALAEWGPTPKDLPDGHRIVLVRGEVLISERMLSKSSGLHRNTIRRLFERTERAGWISFRSAPGLRSNGTIASILIYDGYQGVAEPTGQSEGKLETTNGTGDGTAEGTNIYIDEEGRRKKEEESPLPPAGGGEPELFRNPDTKPVDANPGDAKPAKTRKPRNTLSYTPAEMEDFFTEFKAAYPSSNLSSPEGGHHWTGARRYFDAAVKAKVDPKALIAAAYRYCSETKANKRYGTGYTKDVINWLKERRWEEYHGVHPFPDQTPNRSELYVLTYGEESVEEIKRRRAAIGPYV